MRKAEGIAVRVGCGVLGCEVWGQARNGMDVRTHRSVPSIEPKQSQGPRTRGARLDQSRGKERGPEVPGAPPRQPEPQTPETFPSSVDQRVRVLRGQRWGGGSRGPETARGTRDLTNAGPATLMLLMKPGRGPSSETSLIVSNRL